MAFRRITIQDIADACGLSRNTVSKVFNKRGTVQESTRQMVMKKAQELGYSLQSEEESAPPQLQMSSIALLTRHMPVDYHFGTFFIPSFAAQLSRSGYTLMLYEVTEDELRQGSLPAHINLDKTAALLCIELFDRDYIDHLCGLGLPVLTVDGCCGTATTLLNCDCISMENLASTMSLVNHVIQKGARTIGFVGDPNHCNSFHERWIGFYTALANAELPLERAFCILEPDGVPYSDADWLADRIRRMPKIPDALICVNDYIAIHVMTALKQLGIAIPGQIMVAGFDGTAQSSVVEPSLTTVHIPGADLGLAAADMLLSRITNPSRPPVILYVKTEPIYRETTNR